VPGQVALGLLLLELDVVVVLGQDLHRQVLAVLGLDRVALLRARAGGERGQDRRGGDAADEAATQEGQDRALRDRLGSNVHRSSACLALSWFRAGTARRVSSSVTSPACSRPRSASS